MSWATARRTLVLAAAVAIIGASSGTAAAAADPLVLSQCDSTTEGRPGQRVLLRSSAVTDQITGALRPLDPLNALRPAFATAWGKESPILIGTVLDSRSVISGPVIADAVTDRLRTLDVLDPVIDTLDGTVRRAIAAACAVVTEPSPPPESPDDPDESPPGHSDPVGPEPPAGDPGSTPPRAEQPDGGFVPGGDPAPSGSGGLTSGDLLGGELPEGIPFTLDAADSVPSFDLPGSGSSGLGLSSQKSPGSASALQPGDAAVENLPVLLATVLLSMVTAQLVRMWLLRPPGRLKLVFVPPEEGDH